VAEARAALARLLAPGSSYAARARAIAADYARHDGARETARLLTRMHS
jgi:UDP:flavonoid glycosyltransferase YjiC (YdhE family)